MKKIDPILQETLDFIEKCKTTTFTLKLPNGEVFETTNITELENKIKTLNLKER